METNYSGFTEEQKKTLASLPEKERAELEKIYAKINNLQGKANEKIAKEKERKEKEIAEALESFGKEFISEYGTFNKAVAKDLIQFLKKNGYEVCKGSAENKKAETIADETTTE